MSHENRNFTPLDRLLMHADRSLRALAGQPRARPSSDEHRPHASDAHTAGLMRINHTGEICAQALYHGQAATAGLPHVRQAMEQAAIEEEAHLEWCAARIAELGGATSRLNPVFYTLSFTLGALAGLAGDRWSLGFVAETERQVARHLDHHLQQIPPEDVRTRAILEQMKADELTHAANAENAGGYALPAPVTFLMSVMGRVMTMTTYRF